MARDKLCVGVDIGASSVKLCQIKKTNRGMILEHLGMVALPSETVVDGALMNAANVVDALRELYAIHKVKHKQVALAISGHSVIIKKIALPQMTRKELEASIQWEAAQFIPFDIKDVYIDAQIIKKNSTQQGQMDIILVAAKKDFVNEYTSVIMEAGLEPIICDIDTFAIETMFYANYDIPQEQSIALVNIGAAKTNINIVANGVSSFTRDLAVGGYTFTAEIQKQLGISHEEAEALKIEAHTAQHAREAIDKKEMLTPILEQVSTLITTEIQRSIDFYSASSTDPAPSSIYLCGGGARLKILSQYLEKGFGIPVHMMKIFRKISPGLMNPEQVNRLDPDAAVAVGLALRYPGDA